MVLSNEHEQVNNAILKVFDAKPTIARYSDNKKESTIDILSCKDRPIKGLVACSTIGLFNYNIGYKVHDLDLRIEILGVANNGVIKNILASCAFNIINLGYSCSPDSIFQNVISPFVSNTDMKHVLFVSPFIFNNKIQTLTLKSKMVTWLHIIPISHNEFLYAKKNGVESLELLFDQQKIDIANLKRKSIL